MRQVTGYAAYGPGEPLRPIAFERRDLRPHDVAVRVRYCGVCHSDLHAIEAPPPGHLPLVPGHEFTGEVSAVGPDVTAFAPGDAVVVGNIVDSCGEWPPCRAGREVFCQQGVTSTYLGTDRLDRTPTKGAYSTEYVANDRFVYPLPDGLDPAAAAPLMCAGVTTWDPLQRCGIGPSDTVGIVGLGGLGHLGVKFAKALGAEVAVFTTSPGKEKEALALGADEVVVSTSADAMAAQAGRFDFVLDTASAKHDPSPYLQALRLDGTLCMLGLPERYEPASMALLGRSMTTSGSAGTIATRDMLAFCSERGLVADVEMLPFADVNTALDRLARNDVRWRFVLEVDPR